MATTKFCHETNPYCISSVVPLANFCTIFFGPLCLFPCSEDHCEEKFLNLLIYSKKGFFIILIQFLVGLASKALLNHKLFKEWECYDMEPKNDKDSSLAYLIVGIIATIVLCSVIVTTEIFFIRKKRKNTLAFVDENVQPAPSNGNDNLQPPVSSGIPEFFNENTNATTSGENV